MKTSTYRLAYHRFINKQEKDNLKGSWVPLLSVKNGPFDPPWVRSCTRFHKRRHAHEALRHRNPRMLLLLSNLNNKRSVERRPLTFDRLFRFETSYSNTIWPTTIFDSIRNLLNLFVNQSSNTNLSFKRNNNILGQALLLALRR